ncbi:MAG: hypothetical protein U0359_23250 [Byssovorax sp.]
MAAASSSTLLLDEHYANEDGRFLDELIASGASKKLKSFADRWFADRRPFARAMLLRYIDDGCDRPHHRPLVKALFKKAEAAGDDELMGHFMVAFDRLIKRTANKHRGWDGKTTVRLVHDPAMLKAAGNRDTRAPHFSRLTRDYLRRRAFRYFRALGRSDAERYGKAIRAALALYRDEHLAEPVRLLDAWGLMHALYWSSPVLGREPRGIRVKDGQSMADLAPSPYCPEAWTGCLGALIALLEKAESRTVRAFAIALLRRDYAVVLRSLSLSKIRGLLRSRHEEVQTFAAELLRTGRGVENLSIDEWLDFLSIENPVALPLLCELVEKYVLPQRLSLEQTLSLACAKAAPVAELGLRWARQKPVTGEAGLAAITVLARAGVPHVRQEGVGWVLGLLEGSPAAKPEHLRDLLDARFADTRAQALAVFEKVPRFRDSTLLWAALAESPYDDVRAFLVKHLDARQKTFGADALRTLWVTILLAVHRGGRAKRTALDQIAARVVKQPDEAAELLPLLGIALRSVRATERTAALAAVTKAAFREPALRAAIARDLPELRLGSMEAA